MTRQERLLENTAAIAAEMHTGDHRFEKFYARYGERLGGFPGIWSLCVDMGEAFTAAEDTQDTQDDWIDSIVAFATHIHDNVDRIEELNGPELKKLATAVIKQVMERNGE